MRPLDRFFDRFSRLLAGELAPATLESELGPSSSGTARLGHYAELVWRQHLQVMVALFPVTRRALGGSFHEVVRGYVRSHPPRHWEVNEIGRSFADHLESERPQTPWLAELADLEFQQWSVMTAVRPSDPSDPGLDRTLVVRQYAHNISALYDRAVTEPTQPIVAPPCRDTMLIVTRTHRTERRFLFHPTIEALAVIGRRAGDASVAALGVDAQRCLEAEAQLVTWGVLVARPDP